MYNLSVSEYLAEYRATTLSCVCDYNVVMKALFEMGVGV